MRMNLSTGTLSIYFFKWSLLSESKLKECFFFHYIESILIVCIHLRKFIFNHIYISVNICMISTIASFIYICSYLFRNSATWKSEKYSHLFLRGSDVNKGIIYTMSSSTKGLEPAFQGSGQKPYP